MELLVGNVQSYPRPPFLEPVRLQNETEIAMAWTEFPRFIRSRLRAMCKRQAGRAWPNAASCLSLPNVVCAGGSWVAPKDKVQAGDWAGIEALAREAARIV